MKINTDTIKSKIYKIKNILIVLIVPRLILSTNYTQSNPSAVDTSHRIEAMDEDVSNGSLGIDGNPKQTEIIKTTPTVLERHNSLMNGIGAVITYEGFFNSDNNSILNESGTSSTYKDVSSMFNKFLQSCNNELQTCLDSTGSFNEDKSSNSLKVFKDSNQFDNVSQSVTEDIESMDSLKKTQKLKDIFNSLFSIITDFEDIPKEIFLFVKKMRSRLTIKTGSYLLYLIDGTRGVKALPFDVDFKELENIFTNGEKSKILLWVFSKENIDYVMIKKGLNYILSG